MISAVILTVFLSDTARAEATKSLTWSACVDLVEQNNSELQASRSTLRASEAQEGVARSGFLPTVSGTLGYDRSNEITDSRYQAYITGSQNIFSGFQDLGKVRQARFNAASVTAQAATVRAKVSYDLKTAYQGLLYAKDYLQFTDDVIRRREINLSMVKLLFANGRENKGSVLLSEAYLEQAKYEEIQARDSLRLATNQLARTLGIDEDVKFEVSGDIPIHEPENNPDLRSVATKTPDFLKAAADAEAASAAVTVARSQFYPQLNLTGSVGRIGSEFWPDERDRWAVGLNLTLPLFSGGKDYYGTKAASATFAAADSTRMNVNRDLLAKLQQAYAGFNQAVAKLRVDDSFRKASTLRAEIARKRYNNGLLSFDDWDVIETDLINRQKNYLQSKRDRVINEAAWEQAQGKGVIP